MTNLSAVNSKQLKFVTWLEESPFTRALFGSVKWAWLWLIVRVYVGWP